MSPAKRTSKSVAGVFDSIFDQADFVNAPGVATVVDISLDALTMNPYQPRKHFAEEELEALASSIAAHGILQPIVVREVTMGRFEIIVGERRVRAASRAGLGTVPAIVRDLDDRTTQLLALVENLQREELNPLEETDALLNLLAALLKKSVPESVQTLQAIYDQERGRVRHSAVADSERAEVERLFLELGRFTLRSFVTHRLPLLKLPTDVLNYVRNGEIDYTKATAVARIPAERDRADLLQAINQDKLSLREVQKRVTQYNGNTTQLQTKRSDLKHRYQALGKRFSQSSALDDAKKSAEIERLLEQLDKLLS